MYSRTEATASSLRRVESVLMYVIRPTEPSAPTSIPSYSFWASFIVREAEILNLREASCCRVLVMNGGRGFLLISRFCTLRIEKVSFLMASTCESGDQEEGICMNLSAVPLR